MRNWTSVTDKGCLEGLEFDYGRLDVNVGSPSATKTLKTRRTKKRRRTKAKIYMKGDGLISLLSIKTVEDLRLWPGLNINPPPRDGRCMCCGKHLSELKPFDKPGDPLSKDFSGALLVKTFRWRGFHPDEEDKRILEEFCEYIQEEKDYSPAEERLNQKYGQEAATYCNRLLTIIDSQVVAFWLCRDCIILDEREFLMKLYAHYPAIEAVNMPTPGAPGWRC